MGDSLDFPPGALPRNGNFASPLQLSQPTNFSHPSVAPTNMWDGATPLQPPTMPFGNSLPFGTVSASHSPHIPTSNMVLDPAHYRNPQHITFPSHAMLDGSKINTHPTPSILPNILPPNSSYSPSLNTSGSSSTAPPVRSGDPLLSSLFGENPGTTSAAVKQASLTYTVTNSTPLHTNATPMQRPTLTELIISQSQESVPASHAKTTRPVSAPVSDLRRDIMIYNPSPFIFGYFTSPTKTSAAIRIWKSDANANHFDGKVSKGIESLGEVVDTHLCCMGEHIFVAVGEISGVVSIWSLGQKRFGECMAKIEPSNQVSVLRVYWDTSSSQSLVVAYSDSQISIWDTNMITSNISNTSSNLVLQRHEHSITFNYSFIEDGITDICLYDGRLITALSDGKILIQSIRDTSTQPTQVKIHNSIKTITLLRSPTQQHPHLLTSSADGSQLKLWALTDSNSEPFLLTESIQLPQSDSPYTLCRTTNSNTVFVYHASSGSGWELKMSDKQLFVANVFKDMKCTVAMLMSENTYLARYSENSLIIVRYRSSNQPLQVATPIVSSSTTNQTLHSPYSDPVSQTAPIMATTNVSPSSSTPSIIATAPTAHYANVSTPIPYHVPDPVLATVAPPARSPNEPRVSTPSPITNTMNHNTNTVTPTQKQQMESESEVLAKEIVSLLQEQNAQLHLIVDKSRKVWIEDHLIKKMNTKLDTIPTVVLSAIENASSNNPPTSIDPRQLSEAIVKSASKPISSAFKKQVCDTLVPRLEDHTALMLNQMSQNLSSGIKPLAENVATQNVSRSIETLVDSLIKGTQAMTTAISKIRGQSAEAPTAVKPTTSILVSSTPAKAAKNAKEHESNHTKATHSPKVDSPVLATPGKKGHKPKDDAATSTPTPQNLNQTANSSNNPLTKPQTKAVKVPKSTLNPKPTSTAAQTSSSANSASSSSTTAERSPESIPTFYYLFAMQHGIQL